MLYWLGKADMRKEDIYKIVLYGSYARGDFNTESDIDMMVILNCEKEKVAEYRLEQANQCIKFGKLLAADGDYRGAATVLIM